MLFCKGKNSEVHKQKGFTLVELLVSIGIVVVILGVIVSNQSTYTDSLAVTNLADDISLTLSQAQVYGVSVREFSPGTGNFSISYGLSFSLLEAGSNGSYIYFADRNGDKVYSSDWACTSDANSECLKKLDISRGNYVDSICIVRSNGPDQCNLTERVDISFTRPNTRAQITLFNSGGQSFTMEQMIGVKINFMSPLGTSKSVIVYETGQISVQ